MIQEITYWVTLALMRGITTRRKNEIYVNCYTQTPRISIVDLFENETVWSQLGLSDDEQSIFAVAKAELSNNSFLVEDLMSQGYNIIPLDSADYPRTLKANLKSSAPTVIYTKGNEALLKSCAVAIVGSRRANAVSLQFTSNISQKATSEGKVTVSGFAKGVDKEALDGALRVGGRSIIVLPQGIATFASGFKQYYKQIMEGRVLVMSAFAPNAPWSVELAMARNPLIYGMANEIYVAESDNKGGTWSGVMDGLRRKREIFVRFPEPQESNANILLIEQGAKPVDSLGYLLDISTLGIKNPAEEKAKFEEQVRKLLSTGGHTSKSILEVLKLDWTDAKVRKELRSLSFIEEYKEKNRIYFRIKGTGEATLF
jgi:DNA protecting protein DprA